MIEDQNADRQEDFPVVSTYRVVSIIRSKSKKSAPGKDGISYKVLRGLHIRAIERLRDISEASGSKRF